MRVLFELPAFAALALGAHVALFAGWPGGAPEGAGDGGTAVLSLQGSSGAVEEIVAAWDTAPEASPAPAPMTAPAQSVARPVTPSRDPDREAGAVLAALAPPEQSDDLPGIAPLPPSALPHPEIAAAPGVAPAPADLDAAPARPVSDPVVTESGSTPLAPPAAPDRPSVDTASAVQAPATRPKARPEQVAQGKGGQGARGSRGETAAPSLSDSARRSLMASWGAEIRARVEARKETPASLRASGRPVVRITVTRGGALESVTVIRSSRVAALDEAALRAVRRAGRFPAAPARLDLARASFDLPISFTR